MWPVIADFKTILGVHEALVCCSEACAVGILH